MVLGRKPVVLFFAIVLELQSTPGGNHDYLPIAWGPSPFPGSQPPFRGHQHYWATCVFTTFL